ncbi:MAG: hypothetical protein JXN64_13705 [Spirochaetes bacterium]|nr:hypothetical protein [Spirochaetota bacterium]
MEYRYENCRIGRGDELEGRDHILYRFYEILPGLLSWGTILAAIICSWIYPMQTAFFIIAFDVFWLLKTVYLSMHLRANWKRIKNHINTDWLDKLRSFKHDHIYHMIMLPFYKEDESIVEKTLAALLESKYDIRKIIIVLAAEERAGAEPLKIAASMKKKYEDKFGHFIITVHPDGIPGELAGKGSNIAYAAEKARMQIFDKFNIPYDEVLVSAFDIDTIVYEQYFACLTFFFFKAKNHTELRFNQYLFLIIIFMMLLHFRVLLHIPVRSGKWSSRKDRKGLLHSVLTPFHSAPYTKPDTGKATWLVKIQGYSGTVT